MVEWVPFDSLILTLDSSLTPHSRFMEYRLAGADTPQDLVKRVNELLAEGWKLHGGMTVSRLNVGRSSEVDIMYQPMVRD